MKSADSKSGLEPWMRGTHPELPAALRAVLHALELAEEDVERWCSHLTDEEWNLHPHGLPSAAFHVRHMARSIDRLLTYAEGSQLSAEQLAALKSESDPFAKGEEVLAEFEQTLERAAERLRRFAGVDPEEPRALGRRGLPTSVGGLLIHVADHTQRHAGQMVTTAKLAMTSRGVF